MASRPPGKRAESWKGEGSGWSADLDGDGALLVLVGGEGLGLLGGDDSVARDELGHDTSHRLNAHGERAHVQQKDVLHLHTWTILHISSLDVSPVLVQALGSKAYRGLL